MTVEYKGKFYHSKNKIVSIEDGVAKLINVKQQDKTFTVSEEDLSGVLNYTWYFHRGYLESHGHLNATRSKGMMPLHQFILGSAPDGFVIDHINRDKSNNQRSNLRFISNRGNSVNNHRVDENLSGFIGVVEIKRKITVFRSFIQDQVTHKNIQLGRFNTALEVALAYDLYVLTYLQEGEETNWSLGRYVGFEAELKELGIESEGDIKNLDWKLNLIPQQKTKRHSRFKCCTFRADLFVSRPVFISTFNYPGSYKTKSFYAESERGVLIQRALFGRAS
mgnify:CR=1 FL=1